MPSKNNKETPREPIYQKYNDHMFVYYEFKICICPLSSTKMETAGFNF